MRRYVLTFLLALSGAVPLVPGAVAPARAAAITYTETATVSGTLNGVGFSNQLLTFSTTADTANITPTSPSQDGIFVSPASFSLTGVGSGTLTGILILVASNHSGPTAGGFADILRNGFLYVENAAFLTYDLSTSIGPLSGPMDYNPGTTFSTSAGDLVIASVAEAGNTFQASLVTGQQVPEPATLALLGAGLVALGVARRRKAA